MTAPYRARPLQQLLLERAHPVLPEVELDLAALQASRTVPAVFVHRLVRSVLAQRVLPPTGDQPAEGLVRVRAADLKHVAGVLQQDPLLLLEALRAEGAARLRPAPDDAPPTATAHGAAPVERSLVPQQRTPLDARAAAPERV